MAVPLEKFVQQLEDSGILAGDTIKDFIPPKASPKDAEELARELVRRKKLTKFQAEEVSKGKGKSLVLGNYVLMEKIGAGGMGQVFKARHRRMDRIVAVKLLPPAMTKDQAAIARFEREVKAAAKLRHPNIVAADDADCANGVHFLVMEMVDGKDLSALVKKNGPFSAEKAINYVLQAAKGLEFAHKRGVVHRDIKPANLLLDTEGVVKILDMGLARVSLDGDDAPQADLTSTGTIMGTVDYMAPEQALDTKAADARADIYALGCSLFFLLTGKSTYDGDTLMKKLLAHREQPIPALRTSRPEVTEQLEAVFRRMIAKKLEDRYQSMTEVIVELERCTAGSTTSVTIQQPASTTFEEGSFDFLKKLPEEPTILAKPQPKAVTGKTGNNQKLPLIGVAVLGVVILAGIIVSLRTKDGTLVVEIDQPDAMVQVLDGEGKVEISQKGGKGLVSISVDPGKHRLQIEKDGFTVFGQDFEMKSGGKTPIKAKLVPLEEKPEMSETKAAVAEVKKPLFFQTPGFEAWAKDVAAMSAEMQVEAVRKKLMELNPGFDGKLVKDRSNEPPLIENGMVVKLGFVTDNVTDISPVRVLTGLYALDCYGSSPGKGALKELSPLKGMKLKWFVCDSNPGISDLSPLDGNPLTLLWLPRTKVSDLSPLKGMRLTWLSCESTQITDFAVLKDLPLTELSLDFKPGRDSELLRSIKSLQRINNKPAVEFWKEAGDKNPLFFKTPGFEQWAKDVAAMPAEQQVEAVRRKLMDLNPGFDGKMTPTIENGVVRKLQFLSDNVTDISPVRGLPRLNILSCGGSSAYKGKLADLTPLEGMRLTTLSFGFTQVSDLSPLRGMPLVTLFCGITNIEDLSPLQGMKLVMLHLGMTKISDLSPLRGMPLMQLTVNLTKVSNLSPLEGMALTSLNCSATKVSDLTPLSNMPLKDLNCDFKPERDTELLRSIKTLETINSKPAAEFWKEFEEQQKGKKLGFQMPGFDQWVKDVQAMPAEKQVEAVSKKLVELNPEFDGKVTAGDGKSSPKIENGVVTEFGFVANFVTDISPVRALAGLKVLMCYGSENQQGRLSDLSPLEGMRLQNLICFRTQVSDLSPVRGMPLGGLVVYSSKVSDVAPLEGLPLEYLDCSGLELAGLTPLTECKNLRTLIVRQSIVNPAEITVLQKALPNCKIVWEDPAMSATSPPQ